MIEVLMTYSATLDMTEDEWDALSEAAKLSYAEGSMHDSVILTRTKID